MPSERFHAEFNDLTPSEFFGLVPMFISQKFVGAEIRREAIDRVLKSIMELLPDEYQEEHPKLLSFKDFMETTGDPPPAIVNDILPSKKLICFSGAAKEGKSLVALEILENIATGSPLFGLHDLNIAGGVAYFGMEDGCYEIKERLLARGLVDVPNYYICAQSFDMNSPVGWQTFLSLITPITQQKELQVLIIDTAREAFRGVRDWNDASVVGPIISTLRRWAHQNCTVLLITHNNKDKFAEGVNKIAGSGALVSSCDGFMILSGQTIIGDGDLQWTLEMGGRSVKRRKCFLRMDTNSLHIREIENEEIEGAKNAQKTAEKEETKRRVLAAFSDKNLTVSEVSESVSQTIQWTREIIKELCAENLVETGPKEKRDNATRPVQTFRRANVCTEEKGVFRGKSKEVRATVLDSNHTFFANSPKTDALTQFFAETESEESETEEGWI